MIPRKAMLKLQDRRCYLCGGQFMLFPPGTPDRRRLNRAQCITADHVRPRKAGATLEWNKLLAHDACNVRKADREPRPCELIYLAAINLRIAAMTPAQRSGADQ